MMLRTALAVAPRVRRSTRWLRHLVGITSAMAACACAASTAPNAGPVSPRDVVYEAPGIVRFSGPPGIRRHERQFHDGPIDLFEGKGLSISCVLGRFGPYGEIFDDWPLLPGTRRPIADRVEVDGLIAWRVAYRWDSGGSVSLEFRDLEARGYSPNARLRFHVRTEKRGALPALDRIVETLTVLPGKPFPEIIVR